MFKNFKILFTIGLILAGLVFSCAMPVSAFSFKFKNKKTLIEVPEIQAAIEMDVVFSIDDCIELALKNDPNLRISEGYKGIAKARVGQAKADYFPNLSAGGGFTWQNNDNDGFGNSNSNNVSQVNFGINQHIWNFGRTVAKINMQKYNLEASGYDHENGLLNTVYRVKLAYYGVLAARANQDIAERSVGINQLNYERTNALFQEGLKSKIDVVNAEVYLTDAKIQLLNAENKYNTALVALNSAMYYTDAPKYKIKNTENFDFHKNRDIENEINVSSVSSSTQGVRAYDAKFGVKNASSVTLKKNEIGEDTAILTSGIEKRDILQNFVFTPYSNSLNNSINLAYENRPDLKSLIMVEKASEESLKQVKRSWTPELGASAGYNMRHLDSTTVNSTSVAVGLDFPYVNIKDIKNRVDEAKYYLGIATTNIDLLRKNVYFEVQNNYVNMIQLEKRIPLLGKKVSQTLENFELADGRYTVGLGNFIELQDAQINYNNAQLAYVQAVFDYNVIKTQLERSMGIKWQKEM